MTDSSSVIVRILVWSCWLVLLLDSVYCKVQISASAGSDVLLNCSHTTLRPTVYWRYRESYTVVDIKPEGMDFSGQAERFKDRIITFRDRYAHGNFSVVLKNVNLNDSGPYDCDIPGIQSQQLHLTVTEGRSTAKPGVTSPPSGDPKERPTPAKPRGDSVSVRDHCSSFIILSVILLLTMAFGL